MTDTKLLVLLKKFSIEELKEFEKFTASPYFSRGRDLSPLLKILKSFHPVFDSTDLNNKYIFEKLYAGKSYDGVRSDKLLNTLFSDMYKMCKNFLMQLEFSNDEKKGEYYLLNQLRKKKLYREFEKNLKKFEDSDNYRNKGSIEYFIEKYFFECVKRDYSLDKDDFVNTFASTKKISSIISVMALIKCLRNADENTLAEAYNIDSEYNLTDTLMNNLDIMSLLKEMKENNDEEYPYVLTYYLIYNLNVEKTNEAYFALKDHLNKYMHLFGNDELYILRSILLTYCSIFVAGQHGKMMLREQFDLYDGNLRLGIYKRSREEEFHVVLFRNIALCSGRIGETVWLDNFIKKYSPELPEEHRENLVNFSLGFLHLCTREYEKALGNFSKIRLSLFIFKIDVRLFQLIIYYELNYFDQAYSLLDSTGHFLNDTSEASPAVMESTKNFIKFYRELLKNKNSPKPDKVKNEYLRKLIDDEKILASRDWLISKVS